MPAITTPSGRPVRPPPAVLVLMSDSHHRASIARTVRELGFPAVEAAEPAPVLRRLRAQPALAQLLLVEESLPGMDGGEVAERARDISPALRTAFLSTDARGTDAELIDAYPELPVVRLPADAGALRRVLRQTLGRGSAPASSGERRRQHRPAARLGPAGEIAGPGRT